MSVRPFTSIALFLSAAAVVVISYAQSDKVAALPGGLAATPPMGWNSWNAFGCDIDEQLIREMTDALVASGMAAAGYQYINIDDCWMAWERDAAGDLQPDPWRFPSGIASLADYVHARGLKLGIYTSAGTWTCQGRPGSLGYESRDAARFAEWGVDYLKYDNCGELGGRTAFERYTAMRDALLVTGRPIVYSICNWGLEQVYTWGSTVGHLWRTTFDILPSWDSVMSILDQQVGLEAYSGPGGWNDPDMLEVGNPGLTSIEARAHFSLWAILNAPLIAGNDLRTMSDETRAILTDPDVIAVNQNWGGIQGRRIRDDGEQEVWYKPMSDGSAAVVLLNRSPFSAPIAVTPSEIHLPPAPEYTVLDLWTNEPVVIVERYEATVPGHGAAMVRVSAEGNDGAMYVSDLAATPVANGWGPAERDRSNGEYGAGDGAELMLNGTRYTKGLGVHAYSEIRYALNGQCRTFEANVGIDDEVGALGSVVFHVVVDGIERYTSPVMTGAGASEAVLVDLVGASELALLVTDAGDGPYYDHADWAGAHIHCNDTSASYVSDRPWTSMTNGWGAVERDRSNGELGAEDGRPLTLNGATYTKGLGVHSYSEVRYALNGQCSTFEAVIGVDDEVGSLGSVVFHVVVDGIERYTSGVLTGASASQPVLVSLAGAGELGLVVTDAGDGPFYDHADWADAHVHCEGATSTYLSDRSWTSMTNGWGPVERNRSNGELGSDDGGPVTVDGVVYAKGLGAHAYSEVRFSLNGACSTVSAIMGVDDEVGANGSVTFEIWTDGVLRYDSGIITGSTAARSVSVDVTGARELALIVTDADDGPYYDHADWAQLQATCN
jgi:alpha-galactosidase